MSARAPARQLALAQVLGQGQAQALVPAQEQGQERGLAQALEQQLAQVPEREPELGLAQVLAPEQVVLLQNFEAQLLPRCCLLLLLDLKKQ